MENGRIDWKNSAAMIFCAAAGAAALWLGFRFLFPALLPFLTALLIAASVRPLAGRICAKSRLSPRAVSAILVFLLLALVTLGLSFGIRRLITELGELARGLDDESSPLGDWVRRLSLLVQEAGERVAALLGHGREREAEEIAATVDGMLSDLFSNLLSRIGAGLPGLISSIVSALPRLLIGLAVTVIASFYFALDGGRAARKLAALLPEGVRHRLPHIKKGAARAVGKYLRAYSLILLMTFAELFFGLSVLGAEYSFVIALVTALVDIFPILGVGTVLIPWAVGCFALGDARRGAGLLILYIVVMLVRQFTEPRIVGGSLGIHPLLTLLAMYLGFRLFGFAGMLLGPFAVIAVRALLPVLLPPADAAG